MVSFFQAKLRNYFESGKPVAFKPFFVAAALSFVRSSKDFKDKGEEVKFFIESCSNELKDSLNEPLALVGEPSVSIKAQIKSIALEEVVDGSKLSFGELLREFGPHCSASPEILKKMLLDCDKIDNAEVLKVLMVVSEPEEERPNSD